MGTIALYDLLMSLRTGFEEGVAEAQSVLPAMQLIVQEVEVRIPFQSLASQDNCLFVLGLDFPWQPPPPANVSQIALRFQQVGGM